MKGYKTAGTLLSGWRLTTFMNTVLNYVYTHQAVGSNSNMVSTHNGDDVLASINNLTELVSLLKGSKEINVRYQRTKCYFSSIAEFLRVDHHQGTGAQYLARAVSTFVHGATESSIPNDLRSNLEATMTRRKELIERMADRDVVDKLVRNQLRHFNKIWEVDDRLIYSIINTHTSRGGIATTINDNTLEKKILMVMKKQRTEVTGKEIARYPGVTAYTNKLLKMGIEDKYRSKIERQLYATTQIGIGNTVTEYKVQANAVGLMSDREGIGVHNYGKIYTGMKKNEGTCKNLQLIKDREEFKERDNLIWLRASQYGMFRKSYHGRKAVLAKTFGIPLINIIGKDSAISTRLKLEYDSHEAAKILL
jgi:hypothetical protein